MAARDSFHEVVKTALHKDGWTITHDPLHIRVSGVLDMYSDLGAERVIAVEKAGRKIAVEVKSFLDFSPCLYFHPWYSVANSICSSVM